MQKRGQNRSFVLCNFLPENRRGLSTIIITLILIVVSLVAVAIFWVVVRNLISQQSEGISFEKFAISMDIKKVYSPGANDVAVEVERNPGKAELSGINFIFYTESGSELITQNIPIGELETKTFTLTLQNITAADITKVSIAPIFKANSEIGSIAASYELTGPMESGSYVCTPNSCSALGYNCGSGYANGTCSGTLSCGTCPSGQSCVSGVCQAGSCTPKTSCTTGQCGSWLNGTCSGTLNCGTCPTGQSCNASGMCVAGSCTPTTCSALGFNCGTPANGTCSGTLNCGSCSGGQTCSNSSGGICQAGACTPTTCSALGYNCGSGYANGTCSGTLNCGTCSGGQTCVSGHCQATTGLCTGLVLLMHFDSSTSPTPDSSGNGNDGTVNGATWTSSGRFGGAFSYDGVNDYLSLSSPLTSFAQSSVCMWVNLRNITWTSGYSQTFLNLYLDGSNQLRMGNDETALGGGVFVSYGYSGTQYGRATNAGALSSDSWRHVCYTFNNTYLDIYVGSIVSDLSSNTFSRGTDNLIGSRATVSGFTNGTIDDLAIWNRTLTSTEISSIYSSGGAISC